MQPQRADPICKRSKPPLIPKRTTATQKDPLGSFAFHSSHAKDGWAGHFVDCTKAIANLLLWDFELKQNIMNVPNWLILPYSSAIPTLGKKKKR